LEVKNLMKKKIYCFDLDNTISITRGTDYKKAVPVKKAIKLINELYKKKNKIIIFTGRYMARNNQNIKKVYKQGYKSTFKQLNGWGLKFHKLIMGKPTYDLFVDDKAFGFKKNWYKYKQKFK